MQLIDTHAHIYLPEFDSDRQNMMLHAVNVSRIFMPNIDLDTMEPMMRLQKEYPEQCFPMIGLHPCSVKSDFEEVLKAMEQQLHNKQFNWYGVGETGLDYYWDVTFKQQQIIAFEQQIIWAREMQLPVIIHSRNALADCLELIEKHQDGNLTGVFHCFSGSADELARAVATGLMIGIGGVITFKNGGLDKVLRADHLEHIVLETDSPYLAPVPYRGKRNEPAYLEYIAKKMSELLSIPIDLVAATTNRNASRLFNIAEF